LENDFELGHYMKEQVIPRAVLFFTGEADDDMTEGDSIDFDPEKYGDEIEAYNEAAVEN
jgi:nucleosome assembly protein 1-like 1